MQRSFRVRETTITAISLTREGIQLSIRLVETFYILVILKVLMYVGHSESNETVFAKNA